MFDTSNWNQQQFDRRMTGTLVFHNNHLCEYRGFTEAGKIRLMQLVDGKLVNVNKNELDIAYKPIGFCNLELDSGNIGAFFVNRSPVRRDWKQGLRWKQLMIDRVPATDRMANILVRKINIIGIQDTMARQFRKMRDVLVELEEELDSVALSPNFKLNSDFQLSYQFYDKVGEVQHDDTVKLRKDWSFLKEKVKEELKIEVV
jgi:hypothetical protein